MVTFLMLNMLNANLPYTFNSLFCIAWQKGTCALKASGTLVNCSYLCANKGITYF